MRCDCGCIPATSANKEHSGFQAKGRMWVCHGLNLRWKAEVLATDLGFRQKAKCGFLCHGLNLRWKAEVLAADLGFRPRAECGVVTG